MKRIPVILTLCVAFAMSGCVKPKESAEPQQSTEYQEDIEPEINGQIEEENLQTDEETVQDEPSEVPATKETGKFSGKIICIDPGHGITSRKETEPIYPGATEKKAANVSGTAGDRITEEALNLEVGLKLKAKFEELGATVYITRTENKSDMSNVERAKFANQTGCDMVVRVHADGSESKSVSGVSVLIPSKKCIINGYLTDEIVQKSRRAGEYILEEICRNTGAANKGLSERADMTGFNWSSVPVVLVEMGFLSNREEEAKLITDEYQQKIISGIAAGLEKYFNE